MFDVAVFVAVLVAVLVVVPVGVAKSMDVHLMKTALALIPSALVKRVTVPL